MATGFRRFKKNYDKNKSFKALSKKAKITIIILSIILVVFGILFPVLLNTYSIMAIRPSREYRVGELSDETIYATSDFSYIDTVATEKLYNEAAAQILPQFTYSLSFSILARTRAEAFSLLFDSDTPDIDGFIAKYGIEDTKDVLKRLDQMDTKNASIISRLIDECVINVISIGLLLSDDILKIAENGWDKVMIESSDDTLSLSKKEVSVDELLTRDKLPKYVLEWISKVYPNLNSTTIALITDGVELLAIENISYDEVLTESLISDAKAAVAPVLVEVKRGDELLSVDKLVTEQMLRTIDEINSKAVLHIDWLETLGRFIYLVISITIFLYIFFQSIQYEYRVSTYTIIVLVFTIIVQIAGYIIVALLLEKDFYSVDFFLPFFILPILVAAIVNNKMTGFIVVVFYATLQNVWPTSTIYSFFYIVTCGVICLYLIRFNNDRLHVLTQCIISACAVLVVTLLFSILEHSSGYELLFSLLGSTINVLVSYLLLSILLPIFERIFNIPTGYRLHELSYVDTPALNRLNQVALGTYNHARNVSDMAYVAAKAIGANAELARVGALYHDIGKSEHPEYFIENQTGKNAHDDISSTLSAAIIKSHVKIGVEKAKEIGLPQEVIDIISEHHGNDLIKYFYNEAVRNNKSGSTVSEEDFRYSGRIPSTPESAVVMLSDCVEAATRTIKNPSRQKYDKFISNIISDKISYKQLDNSQLTITDLDTIKEAFIHQLMGRDHHRIEYDNDR